MAIADLIAKGGNRLEIPDFAQAAIEGAQAGRQAQMQKAQMYSQGLQNQDVQQQIQQRTLANLATQRDQTDLANQREAMSANTSIGDGGPTLDQQGYISQLAQKNPMQAYSEQKRLKSDAIVAAQQEIDRHMKELSRRTQILAGVQSPMQFTAAIAEMDNQGIDTSELRAMPFMKDWKEKKDALVNQGLTIEQQGAQRKQALEEQKNTLAWQKEDKDYEVERQKMGETGRHNKAIEGVDWYKAMHPASLVNINGLPAPTSAPTGIVASVLRGDLDPNKLPPRQKAAILDQVAKYEPSFDMNRAASSAAARNDFSHGKEHDQVQSLNMLTEHLDGLKEATKGMGGLVSSVGKSLAGPSLSGDVGRFRQARAAVVGELEKLYKGGMPADKALERALEDIPETGTVEARNAAIDEAIRLVGGRLIAKREQLNSLAGRDPKIQILSPRSKGILSKYGHDDLVAADKWDPSAGQPLSAYAPGYKPTKTYQGATYEQQEDGSWAKQ